MKRKTSITIKNENGKMTIRNGFYVASFDPRRGGVINYLRALEPQRSPLYREGCEIWRPKWGEFTPNHYQQEVSPSARFEIKKEATTIKVKVASQLGNPHNRRLLRGWCINNWIFKNDTPLIHCDAQIGSQDTEQAEVAEPNLFKKYICFHPGIYKYWAYKEEDGEVVSGPLGWDNLTPHFVRNGAGYNFVLTKGKWITLFNDTQGFAFLLFGNKTESVKTNEYLMFWQSKSMEEILYSHYDVENSKFLSLDYLDYATTPKKKWIPVDDIYEGKGISTKT